MKKSHLCMVGISLLIVVGAFMLFSSEPTTGAPGKNPDTVPSGEVQKVSLGMKDYNYYPQTLTVKAGIPVELTLDESVVGCLRAFTIPELGVNKFVRTPKDKIIFTPTEPGTYRFACTMNMAYGTLVVE